jgi:hypothetical protein
MNKVDLQVRAMMNTYPTLYPDRLSCLRGLFTTGNYHWNKKGCLVPAHADDRDPSVMNFSDLDEREARLTANEFEAPSSLQAKRAYELKVERTLRQLRADNIDLVASSEILTGGDLTYEQLSYMPLSSDYLSKIYIGGAPFGKIDADWLAAAEEFIGAVKASYNRIFNLNYDLPIRGEKAPEPSMHDRMPENFQRSYAEICEIDDKLEAQSGKRARMMEMMNGSFFKDLMDEIIAEDNKPVA